ncbi:hypothetical protein FRC12_017223 [Ceratobasidium sp. 428]|nr:hypothetical protein FRC12_017223 [Ceratobasidium sp. 428]
MTTLIQTETSVLNTQLTGPDGLVLYETATPTKLFSDRTTTISRQGMMIAAIDWRLFGGAALRFEGREALLDNVFPKSHILSRSRTYTTREGVSFKWKIGSGEFYCVAPDSGMSMASFDRVSFAPLRTKKSSLHINDLALGLIDELVVTWVIMEKLSSDRRKNAAGSGGG